VKLELDPKLVYEAIERGVYRAFRDAMAVGDVTMPDAGDEPAPPPRELFNNEID
jgi:hypothetical protein